MENGAEMKQTKAILDGCKYFLQVIINLHPSGCPNTGADPGFGQGGGPRC